MYIYNNNPYYGDTSKNPFPSLQKIWEFSPTSSPNKKATAYPTLETNRIFAPENWKMNFVLGQFWHIFRGQTMLVLRECNYKGASTLGGNSFSRMQQPSPQGNDEKTYPTYYRLKSQEDMSLREPQHTPKGAYPMNPQTPE